MFYQCRNEVLVCNCSVQADINMRLIVYVYSSNDHCFWFQMLKILQQNLKRGEIKYYWDKRCNLIEGFQEKHKENLVCRLDNIIAHIERNVSESPIVIAEHIRKFCGFRLYTHCRMEEPLALEASEWLNKNSVLCLHEA